MLFLCAFKAPRKIRVYTDGIYDIFHFGHSRQLMEAKNLFPNIYLMVGICNDKISNDLKSRTVLTAAERYESVRHCRYVDEIITEAPLIITDDFLNENKIDFVAQDPTPYPLGDIKDIYEPFKKRNIFLETHRTEGISTSEIICRILRDFDVYVKRNLSKGYSIDQLNLKCFKVCITLLNSRSLLFFKTESFKRKKKP
jgi:choline-phosphate cytidylyltransferase